MSDIASVVRKGYTVCMQRLFKFIAGLALICGSSAFAKTEAALRVYDTASTHPDRIAIGQMLMEGSENVIEPFAIKTIRIADRKKISVAYVDARSTSTQCNDCEVFGAIIIRAKGGNWKEIWTEGSGGSNDCARGKIYVQRLNRYLKKQKIALADLAPAIHAKLYEKEEDCLFGDLSMDEAIFGKEPQ